MKNVTVQNDQELLEFMEWAVSEKESVSISGNGSKQALGHEVTAGHHISLTNVTGVKMYEAAELVMRAGAGSLLTDIEKTLDDAGQRLAFTPPDLGPLFGKEEGRSTLGGVFSANLSGSARIKAGAARDHLLGARGVTGRGQAFQTGSRVMKNVTGYDLCKLITGSYGTLAICSEFTFKVLPKPEKTRTVLLYGLSPEKSVEVMRDAMSSVHEVSATAFLPSVIADRTGIDFVVGADTSVTAILIDGVGPSVLHRCEAIKTMFKAEGTIEELHGSRSAKFWKFVGSGQAFAGEVEQSIWRVSVAPSAAPALLETIKAAVPGVEHYLDWAGGLIWLSVPSDLEDAGAATIRSAVGSAGHATLMRAKDAIKSRVDVFQPQPAPIQKITEKIKEGFDPYGLLNPGKMYPGARG